jgi:photosystem II stability/assembly factor-like uncharacterized protein
VFALAVDPKFPAAIYAGTRAGLWKTIDGGATWRRSGAGLPETGISALAVDPVDTQKVYAGAVDGNLYRTMDGGTNWSLSRPDARRAAIEAIAIDPNHPNYVFAGGTGVFRSADAGNTWTDINAGAAGPWVWSLAVDARTSLVYLVDSSGLYTMSYDGATWARLGADQITADIKPRVVAIDRAAADTILVGAQPGFYRTTDAGNRWINAAGFAVSAISPAGSTDGMSMFYLGTDTGVFTEYTFPNGLEFVFQPSRTTTDRVVALASHSSDPSIAYAGTATGVYKTTDRGGQWQLSMSGLTGRAVYGLAVDPGNSSNVLVGMEDGGLFRSTDRGANWLSPNSGPGIEAISFAFDESYPKVVWAGGEFLMRSSDGGNSWSMQPDAPKWALSLIFSPVGSGTVYMGSQGNVYAFAPGTSGWIPVGSGLPSDLQVGALAVGVAGSQMNLWAGVYAKGWFVEPSGGDGGVYRTANGGASWTLVGLRSRHVSALAVHPSTPSTVYAGTFDDGVWKTTDDGMNWTASSNGLGVSEVTALAMARSKPEVLYAGTRRSGIFRSKDAGASWAPFSRGLGSLRITRLEVDRRNPEMVYAGTWDGGVFRLGP